MPWERAYFVKYFDKVKDLCLDSQAVMVCMLEIQILGRWSQGDCWSY